MLHWIADWILDCTSGEAKYGQRFRSGEGRGCIHSVNCSLLWLNAFPMRVGNLQRKKGPVPGSDGIVRSVKFQKFNK